MLKQKGIKELNMFYSRYRSWMIGMIVGLFFNYINIDNAIYNFVYKPSKKTLII